MVMWLDKLSRNAMSVMPAAGCYIRALEMTRRNQTSRTYGMQR